MTPGTVTACFYKGRGLSAWIVRYYTRRPGQAWADVPAHCAFTVDGVLCEFIAAGYHSRPAVPADYQRSYDVIVPDIDEAKRFTRSEVGDKYRFNTLFLIWVARFVPDRWLAFTLRRDNRVCSWYVLRVLVNGGWPCPHWLAGQFTPECPNDVLFAVRETLGLTQG
jgi:hypothetical protein